MEIQRDTFDLRILNTENIETIVELSLDLNPNLKKRRTQ
jgi:hypothetical protein